jgi:hypothetical protein
MRSSQKRLPKMNWWKIFQQSLTSGGYTFDVACVNFVVFSPWLRRLTSAWPLHRRCRPGPFFGRTASSAPWGLAHRCWTSTAGGSIAEPKRDDLVTSPLILTISNPYLFYAIETDYSSPWITKNRVLTLWFSL